MPVSLNNNVANVTTTKTLPHTEPKKEEVKEPQKSQTKTEVLVGSGLAALAAIGIYIATRKKVPTNAQSKVQGIIKEGLNYDGTSNKAIIDAKTGKIKEFISYFETGKECSHMWYDCTIPNYDVEKRITKLIEYDKNGDIYLIQTYSSPGIISKHVRYCSPEEKKEYGQNILNGTKYYPNGNIRFEMNQCPTANYGIAMLYDENGNIIKERTFITKTGMKNNVNLPNWIPVSEIDG